MIMTINKRVTLVAYLLILISACGKETTKPCRNAAYSFKITSTWSPQRLNYNIADTIHLESVFPKTLVDLQSNQLIDYSGAKSIGGNLIFYKLDSINHTFIPSFDKFFIGAVNGSFNTNTSVPNKIINIVYSETASLYIFRVAIVPLERGIFALAIVDLGSQGIVGKNCTNAGFVNTLTNTDKNLQLFEAAIGRPPVSQYEIDRYFCFRVQ